MSVNTSETGLPFLVLSYLLLHPDAALTRADIEGLFGVDARVEQFHSAETNGLLAVERPARVGHRDRPANVYRAGEALMRIRAKVLAEQKPACGATARMNSPEPTPVEAT